jgi:hypothetical protein
LRRAIASHNAPWNLTILAKHLLAKKSELVFLLSIWTSNIAGIAKMVKFHGGYFILRDIDSHILT